MLTILAYFFFTVVNENVSLVISRQVLTDVSNRLLLLPDEISKAVSHYTLDKVAVIFKVDVTIDNVYVYINIHENFLY